MSPPPALDDKVESLKAESKRVEDAVMTLGELQKTLGERIKKISNTQTSAGLTIAMVKLPRYTKNQYQCMTVPYREMVKNSD